MTPKPLLEAYELVDRAESLVLKQQYLDASKLHKKASDVFKANIGSSTNKEINRALEILAAQHLRRSKELAILEHSKGVKKEGNLINNNSGSGSLSTPPSPLANSVLLGKTLSGNHNISASLASARGIQKSDNNNQFENFVNGSMVINGSNGTDDIDPLMKFQIQVYNLMKAPNLINNVIIETPNVENVKKSGKSLEELEIENQMLKELVVNYSENLQIYESFHKKVKNNLRNYLNVLKKELQLQENKKIKELELKVELTDKENKKLASQIKKLKQRWDGLVESAKKRREDSHNENKS